MNILVKYKSKQNKVNNNRSYLLSDEAVNNFSDLAFLGVL